MLILYIIISLIILIILTKQTAYEQLDNEKISLSLFMTWTLAALAWPIILITMIIVFMIDFARGGR